MTDKVAEGKMCFEPGERSCYWCSVGVCAGMFCYVDRNIRWLPRCVGVLQLNVPLVDPAGLADVGGYPAHKKPILNQRR